MSLHIRVSEFRKGRAFPTSKLSNPGGGDCSAREGFAEGS